MVCVQLVNQFLKCNMIKKFAPPLQYTIYILADQNQIMSREIVTAYTLRRGVITGGFGGGVSRHIYASSTLPKSNVVLTLCYLQ